MPTALHIDVNGNRNVVNPQGLADYQQLVGGYIELVGFPDGTGVYVNEEGALMGLPQNAEATRMVVRKLGERDGLNWLAFNGFLRGDAVFIGPADDEGNTLDLPGLPQ